MKKVSILILFTLLCGTSFSQAKKDTVVRTDTATENLINKEQSAVYINITRYVQDNFQNLTIKEANRFFEWLIKLIENSGRYYIQELEKKKPPKK
jgi:hypothetical protein